METNLILNITLKRKKIISFLLNTPNLPSNIINLCLGCIDALAVERDLLIKHKDQEAFLSN